jgi:crotonobetainyl-CoA:carnitine CoA-transferase CaiB-like acyl-CoA transferase
LAVGNDGQFKRLCQLLNQPGLADDARFAQNSARVVNRDALVEQLEPAFALRTVDEWVSVMQQSNIPAGRISDLPEALSHPQLLAREMISTVDHPVAGTVRLLSTPLRLLGVNRAPSPPPGLGEHTAEVLLALGLPADEVRRLSAAGILCGPR